MSASHDLARQAAVDAMCIVRRRGCRASVDDQVADIIADNYAAPMAELKLLRGIVGKLSKIISDCDGLSATGSCVIVAASDLDARDSLFGILESLPHNEVAT